MSSVATASAYNRGIHERLLPDLHRFARIGLITGVAIARPAGDDGRRQKRASLLHADSLGRGCVHAGGRTAVTPGRLRCLRSRHRPHSGARLRPCSGSRVAGLGRSRDHRWLLPFRGSASPRASTPTPARGGLNSIFGGASRMSRLPALMRAARWQVACASTCGRLATATPQRRW